MRNGREFRIADLMMMGISGVLLLGLPGCGEKPNLPPEGAAPTARSPISRNDASPAMPPVQDGKEMIPVLWEGYGEGPNMTGADSQMIVHVDEPEGTNTIRVAALLQRLNGDVLVGLVSEKDGKHAIARVGDMFMGCTVIKADVLTGEVVLERGGEQFSVTLQRSSRQPAWPVAEPQTAPATPSPQMADGIAIPPATVYEPTANEKEKGIDPNDPSTWKPGYLGPGIERARASEPRFEPTSDESKEGIDPNDPATWPEGYRGPAIERAMKGQ